MKVFEILQNVIGDIELHADRLQRPPFIEVDIDAWACSVELVAVTTELVCSCSVYIDYAFGMATVAVFDRLTNTPIGNQWSSSYKPDAWAELQALFEITESNMSSNIPSRLLGSLRHYGDCWLSIQVKREKEKPQVDVCLDDLNSEYPLVRAFKILTDTLIQWVQVIQRSQQ